MRTVVSIDNSSVIQAVGVSKRFNIHINIQNTIHGQSHRRLQLWKEFNMCNWYADFQKVKPETLFLCKRTETQHGRLCYALVNRLYSQVSKFKYIHRLRQTILWEFA